MAQDDNGLNTLEGPSDVGQMLERGHIIQQVRSQYAMAVAVQKPRDPNKVLKACLAEAELAAEDINYSIPFKTKAGKEVHVQGATIDCAIIAASNWGNAHVDCALVGSDAEAFVFAATFVDFQRNFIITRPFRQQRERALSERQQKSENEMRRQEDISFQIGSSKAMRNVILNAIPSYIIDAMRERARTTSISNIPERKAAALTAFANEFEISQDELEIHMGKPCATWASEDIMYLRSALSALRELRVTKEEFLKPREVEEDGTAKTVSGAEGVKARAEAKSQATASSPSGADAAVESAKRAEVSKLIAEFTKRLGLMQKKKVNIDDALSSVSDGKCMNANGLSKFINDDLEAAKAAFDRLAEYL